MTERTAVISSARHLLVQFEDGGLSIIKEKDIIDRTDEMVTVSIGKKPYVAEVIEEGESS